MQQQETISSPPQTGSLVLGSFVLGRLLGKGGFARVFELLHIDQPSVPLAAAKVILKTRLKRESTLLKLRSEIMNHSRIESPHIVAFLGCYEDQDALYILTELCHSGSLKELLRHRKHLTEYETRSWGLQLLSALTYLNSQSIIHRDIKLANLFLDQNLQLKLGDFGLSALVPQNSELRLTVCGTPNYIAPEVLEEQGHSSEVDIWGFGIVLFTLMTGRPPFAAPSPQLIYSRIMENNFIFPKYLSPEAESLLKSILKTNPQQRPTLEEIRNHSFFSKGLVLKQPFPQILGFRPLTENQVRDLTERIEQRAEQTVQQVQTLTAQLVESLRASQLSRDSWILSDKKAKLEQEVKQNPFERILEYSRSKGRGDSNIVMDIVDCSKHYGLCYRLSSGTVGALFNDGTKSLISANAQEMLYKASGETSWEVMSAREARQCVGKKFKLMKEFRVMLGRGKENEDPEETDQYLSLNPSSLQPLFALFIKAKRNFIIVELSDARTQYINQKAKWSSFLRQKAEWRHISLKKGVLYESESFITLDSSHSLYKEWRSVCELAEK